MTAISPEIRHPGFSLSSCSALPSGRPTTLSLLIVLSDTTGGAPAKVARGPMASEKGVAPGWAQS